MRQRTKIRKTIMRLLMLVFSIVAAIAFGCQNSFPGQFQSTSFYTANGKLYDANRSEFIPRGINNLHVWFDDNDDDVKEAFDALEDIAGFGFNSVRVVWQVEFLGRKTNDATLEQIIERIVELNMIPTIGIWDVTGSTDKDAFFNKVVSWWTDRSKLWQKYENKVLINIANEFGDYEMAYKGDRRVFPEIYKEAITRIRDAGINNTLVIDSFDWSKDYTLIGDFGREIYNHDPKKNVVFDIHFYCGSGEKEAEITEAFKSITEQKLPLLVGEFSHMHPMPWVSEEAKCDVKEKFIMSQAQKYGVGYYAWAWHNKEFSVASDWRATSRRQLTPWGKTLVFDDPNSVVKTAHLATVFDRATR
ncbi:cellulase family glycosylhydrolase [Pleurocapsales cyanobacterium LEGE 06147]|nr:cellulase family glycosylhydrolase [Pleurocapsales cyanobacterium LEGE 06147]